MRWTFFTFYIYFCQPFYNSKILENLFTSSLKTNFSEDIEKLQDYLEDNIKTFNNFSKYDNFIVDEKYILKIIVENYENKEEKLKVCFVNLITKSEENIKKSKEILLRGKDEFEINKN